MSPEMDPYWLLKELDQFPRVRRTALLSAKKINVSTAKIVPVLGKTFDERFHQRADDREVKAATSTQIFSINQTDKGQGTLLLITHAC